MRLNADKELVNIMHLNQYKNEFGTTFVKLKKDPRVTRFGSRGDKNRFQIYCRNHD